MPLGKPAGYSKTDYMPLQNLKEHPRTDYMPCNTCVPYYYLIIFRSSHCHTEHNPDTHNTTLTSTTMGGRTCHHVGKDLSSYINDHGRPTLPPCWKGSWHLHQQSWEAHPATMSKRLSALRSMTMAEPAYRHVGKALNTYINDHGRPNLPPCQKGSHHLHQWP